MLNAALSALEKYDWGTETSVVAPIEDAVAATHDNAAARAELEAQLVGVLKSGASRDAKDYVCRKLATIGTAASVPTLAALVVDKNHSHMARYALERIPDASAGQALNDALGRVDGDLKIGIISSLGSRREAAAVAALGGLLSQANAAISKAAALALGTVGSAEAASTLQQNAAGATAKPAVIDGLLSCAEALLASNQTAAALTIYQSLKGDPSRLVHLAATRGLLACAAKQS
jgi:hypothetical protein